MLLLNSFVILISGVFVLLSRTPKPFISSSFVSVSADSMFCVSYHILIINRGFSMLCFNVFDFYGVLLFYFKKDWIAELL